MTMRYTTGARSDHDANESRADRGEHALAVSSDCQDAFTDLSDALANLMHFADRAGLDFSAVVNHARVAYAGDMEDGPRAARNAARFPATDAAAEDVHPPDVLGDPPCELAAAWDRFQRGERVEEWEVRALDEWRADRAAEDGY